MIEDFREAYGKIWMQHEAMNDCFGFSILTISLIAFLNIAIVVYFAVLESTEAFSIEGMSRPLVDTFHITLIFMAMIKTCETSHKLVRRLISN